MDTNRFFRWLGRTNTILFTLVTLAALIFLLGNLLWWPGVADAPHGPKHAADANQEFSYEFNGGLEYFDEGGSAGSSLSVPDGSREAVMVLKREHHGSYGGLSSERVAPEETVNVLMIDLLSAKSHWLFRGTARFIGATCFIRAAKPAPAAGDNPVVALLLAVADTDSNGDGAIDAHDEQSLYIYRPGTPGAVKLLAAKAITNVVQVDSGKVLVTYYDGKADHVVFYATSDFTPLAQSVLASTPD